MQSWEEKINCDGYFISKLCTADIWYCARIYNCKIGQRRCFKRRIFFFKTEEKGYLKLQQVFFIAKQDIEFIWNCDRKFFAKQWSADILNSTMWNGSYLVYRNFNCVIICHVMYLIFKITVLPHWNFHTYTLTTLIANVVHTLRNWMWNSFVLEGSCVWDWSLFGRGENLGWNELILQMTELWFGEVSSQEAKHVEVMWKSHAKVSNRFVMLGCYDMWNKSFWPMICWNFSEIVGQERGLICVEYSFEAKFLQI